MVFDRGLTITGVAYVEAIAAIHAAGRKLATFLKRYDVILSATLPAPPPRLGYFDMNGDVEVFNKRVTEYCRSRLTRTRSERLVSQPPGSSFGLKATVG